MSIKCVLYGTEVERPCSCYCPVFEKCLTAYRAKEKRKKQTNADCIRAMSDEELAAFLDGVQEEECKANHEVQQDGTFKFESLRDGWLAWLQEPAEEVDHE